MKLLDWVLVGLVTVIVVTVVSVIYVRHRLQSMPTSAKELPPVVEKQVKTADKTNWPNNPQGKG